MTFHKNIRSIDQLAAALRSDPELEAKFKEKPAEILDNIRSNAIPDTKVYQIVVKSLGAAILVSLVGAIAIALYEQNSREIPDILVATASAAVGALAGLLAPQPS